MSDSCPLNPSGHKFFIFKTYETFELAKLPDLEVVNLRGANGPSTIKSVVGTVYRKAEYAILGCNCGSAISRKVEQV